jgi:hypothetical protein
MWHTAGDKENSLTRGFALLKGTDVSESNIADVHPATT